MGAAGEYLEKKYRNRIGMKFNLIPSGEFMMGQVDIAEPIHRVIITKSFYIGIYPVTQKQWDCVMDTNPSILKRDDLPVTNISWHDSQEFLKRLNDSDFDKNNDSTKYRLPTEAEWEYACRASSTSMFYFDHKSEDIDDYIWHLKNSNVTQEIFIEKGILEKKLVKITKTGRMIHPVGKLKPNKFGLYDMHGNVYEWCDDWYGDYPEDTDTVTDPKNQRKIGSKIFRGGSCKNFAGYGASAHRDCRMPSYTSEVVGVRIVRNI